MKYSELIQFEPIESVIQLRHADDAERAKQLVNTYVFSDVMADRLSDFVIPQLDIDSANDAKGLLVVGNYGTGKSHVMSVVSSIAEREDLLESLQNEKVKEAAKTIAGRFKAIRFEIGATEMGLREIITQNIESSLRGWDIDFKFPSASEVSENKSSFEELMAVFEEKFPGKGLLVVVDELLDYLRSRNQQPLTLDLGFLREIGEVCRDLRFRFIAGIQEAIFDSDRFAFVSQSISRVKDRFDQIRIQKTDLTFVVANRLLKKSESQKQKIRAYLEPFSRFYDGWTEHMEEYVELFPVHPDYINNFENLPVVEQRGVLQVLSLSLKAMLDEELPSDYPGILALDSFWSYLTGDRSHRTNEDVRATWDCSELLVRKISTGFPKNRKAYQGIAKRIVEGLSVHRLTTSDINTPIGMSPEEIRDQLCLYHPLVADMGGEPAEDLLTLVEVTLKSIRECVSGQYLTQNEDNRQYFLDLKKTEDFDALIEKRIPSLNLEDLDIAYFSALSLLLEATEETEFQGYRIWETAMLWKDRNATKLGWLFFGVPSERSTAQPPRDFYVYFPQIIDPPKFKDEKKADEVFFRLDSSDEKLRSMLSLYAAALALQTNATGSKKTIYARKAETHFGALSKWLRENFLSKIKVTYQGVTKTLSQSLAGENPAGKTTKEQVHLAASKMLNAHFEDICGDYPKFSRTITFGRNGNAQQAVQEALRALHSNPSQIGAAVLDGLALYDGEKIVPQQSPYANYILSELHKKGHGQVLNRNELTQSIDTIEYFVNSGTFRLELELLLVVFGALVHSGDIVLTIPGKEFSATDLAELSTRPVRDLLDFKHIKQPKDWNVPALKALFELLDLSPGLAVQVTQNSAGAVTRLIVAIASKVEKLVIAKQQFANGIPFWGAKLLEDHEITALSRDLDVAKQFLESLQAFNTPGKLKNFNYSVDDIAQRKPALAKLAEIEELNQFADSISEYTRYLSNAESALSEGQEWRTKCKALRDELRKEVIKPENRSSKTFRDQTIKSLQKLKKEYIALYLKLYSHSRLDLTLDRRKQALLNDAKMSQLNALASIPTMIVAQLNEIRAEFGSLKTGNSLTADDLEENPVCGEFYPAMENASGASAEQRLNNLETKIERTRESWIQSLLTEFEDPATVESLKILSPDEQAYISEFLKDKEIAEPRPVALAQAISTALRGLISVPISPIALEQALFPTGSAATVDDFKESFNTFLEGIVKGHDRAKIRLVLDKPNEGLLE